MKKSLAICVLMSLLISTVNAQIQLVTTTRMDELKILLPVDSVNKILGTNIKLKQDGRDFNYDTLNVLFKADSVRLVFSKFINNKNKLETSLVSIYSNGKTLKTKSGLKPGDNKFDIIKKLDGSTMRIAPDWHLPENAPDKKAYSVIALYDYDNNGLLNFYFFNNTLYAFEVASMGEGE